MSLHKHIALQHRRSRQLPAFIVSWVGTLALICSALAVASGVVIVGISLIMLTTNPFIRVGTALLIAFMGGIVSFLVEGMTIANCSSLKDLLAERAAKIQAQAKAVEGKQITQAVRDKMDKQLASNDLSIKSTTVGIVVTSLVSAILSTLFWHYLLSLGNYNSVEGWIYSTTFSVVVTIALVYSELKSDSFNRIVASSISSVGLLKQAIEANITEKVILRYGDSMDAKLRDEADNNESMQEAATNHVLQIVSNTIRPGDNALLETMREQRMTRIAQESQALSELDNSGASSQLILPPGYKNRVDKQKSWDKYNQFVTTNGVPSGAEDIERAAKEVGVSPQTIYRYNQQRH